MNPCFNASLPIRFVRSLPQRGSTKPRSSTVRNVAAIADASMKVDAHVHVWDPAFPTHPDHPLPPSLPGTATDLLAHMDRAGIDKAVIVQPINYKFDHTCVSDAISRYPSRFVGVALADSSLRPDAACEVLEKLVKEGFRGVRLNPTFTATGFADETVAALVKRAGELDVPVALFARPQHLDDVAQLLQKFPQTKILLDHFAFCAPSEQDNASEKVLAMGRQWKQLYVKTSAWFRLSKESWPHSDLHCFLTELVDNFGAKRLLIGSDYPFVKEQYDYSQALSLLEKTTISADDRDWILGNTAAELYKL